MATAFEKFWEMAGSIPGVKVNKTEYLTKAFQSRCANRETFEKILKDGPYKAGVPLERINKIADSEISGAAITATGASFLSGIPGGALGFATIPADLTQFYAHVLIIIQKLMYLYGWEEDVFDEAGKMDNETQTMVILYIGLMFGVGSAAKLLSKIAAEISVRVISKKAFGTALKVIFNKTFRAVLAKIVKTIGMRTVVKGSWNFAHKGVPVVGGIISGVLTLTTLVPMAKKLKNYLSNRAIGELDLTDEFSDLTVDADNIVDSFDEFISKTENTAEV